MVAVFEVTACIRCEAGTIFAVIAERAGPPKVLVRPSTNTIPYICQGRSCPIRSKIVDIEIRMKLKPCVKEISFFLFIESAKAPPKSVAGI